MRAIERTSRFKRDYKRESRGRYRHDLDERLAVIVNALANDIPLDARHHDHALSGPWRPASSRQARTGDRSMHLGNASVTICR